MSSIKPDTVVRLGDVEFSGFEVPAKITFGGEQTLANHDMVGDVRIVDAMGARTGDLTWSGLFQGENALARARLLDEMRQQGREIVLTWSELRYTVVISEFFADFERVFRLPYRITCVVVEDQGATSAEVATKITRQMTEDAQDAVTQAQTTRVQSVIDAAKEVRTQIETVTDIIRAAPATVTQLRNAVGTVVIAAREAITEAEALWSLGIPITDSFGLGGDAVDRTVALYGTMFTAQRMTQNLDAFGQEGYETIMGGGDLYRVAADVYGDPAEWVTIAANNPGLAADPTVQGIQSVIVPSLTLGTGGVLPGAA